MSRRWRLLITLPVLLGGVILLVDQRESPPPHRAEWLHAKDVTLRAVRAGEGEPTLLLLHGYAESLLAYQPILDRLARHNAVLAVDLPGFGLSDKPDTGYTLEDFVARIEAVLDEDISGPVVVVGHSMGGEIAAALALARPDRVTGLVLIDAAGYGLSPAFTTVVEEGSGALGWINAAIGVVLPLHDPGWLEESPEHAAYDPLTDPRYRAASTQVLRAFDFAALRTSFQDIRQATLLIWGANDPTVPLAFGEAIHDLVPCSRLVVLPRMLHRPHQTSPDTVAFEIERFMGDPPGCPATDGPPSHR